MEQRDLTEYLSQETVARLTEEAFSSEAFSRQEKTRRFPKLAAMAACLALVVIAVNFDTVYAAVQSLLYFLPGRGPVAEQTFPDYWVPTQEYAAHTEEGDYLVTYLYRWGDTLSLRVKKVIEGRDLFPDIDRYAAVREAAGEHSSTAPEAVPILGFPQLDIRDEAGNLLVLEDGDHGVFAVYSPDRAEFEAEWEFPDFTLERFTLILDGAVEFPVELRKIDLEDYAVSGGTTVRDKGYAVTLLPLNRNCSRFALLTALEEGAAEPPAGSYWNPLTFDIAAVGESGTEYQAESVSSRPNCQEFYLPELPEEQIISVTVTGILESTRYQGKERPVIRLPALEPGEEVALDTELTLWNDTLTVEAAGLTKEGELWVRFWCHEDGRRLNQIDLEWKEDHLPSQRTTVDEVGGYTTAALEMGERAGKKTTLPISFVSVVQEGRWEFSHP